MVVNPGSTSTKVSVYDDSSEISAHTIRHSTDELRSFGSVAEQFPFREGLVLEVLDKAGIGLATVSAVIGRGGLVDPVASGVYEVNEALRRDLIRAPQGEHASNLGGLIAADIASRIDGAKAYIADPVVVDEMEDVARVAGHPLFRRTSVFHALNQKAVARIHAARIGKKYEDLNLIVAHLGGGITIGAHRAGRVVDVNNALDGEGPFSPDRSGTLPARQLVELCFSGKYSESEVLRMICGEGGLVALAGSNDVKYLTGEAARGDIRAANAIEAMAYQVGKTIASMAAVLEGKVDAVLITGGIAHNGIVCDRIRRMTEFIAPVAVIPGEDEMRALAENALRVLRGEQSPRIYR